MPWVLVFHTWSTESNVTRVFSSQEQLRSIASVLSGYLRLPFSGVSIPGAVVENVIATVRLGEVLNTYDFVDVINESAKVGWQVKSTKAATPVTWKRAKIPDANRLIRESEASAEGCQNLGNAILHYCNAHAKASLNLYKLQEIGYSRIVVHDDRITYFERLLCDHQNPDIFDETQFEWHWSTQKLAKKKEQLSALHGYHKETGCKWFAWHGRGENQLHFSGESNWWPTTDEHTIEFSFPSTRLSYHQFSELLKTFSRL